MYDEVKQRPLFLIAEDTSRRGAEEVIETAEPSPRR
jgi:hypothetical protein